MRDQLEGLESRILHRSLHAGVPAPYRDRLRACLDIEGTWEGLSAHWRQQIDLRLLAQRAPLFPGFRLVQVGAYLCLLLLLLAALADQGAGRAFLGEPGWGSAFLVLFSIVKTLFSLTGLGAVVTFGLIQVFLGIWFYRRYQTRLEKRARKTLQSLKRQLGRMWSVQLDRIEGSLKDFSSELAEQHRALTRHVERQ